MQKVPILDTDFLFSKVGRYVLYHWMQIERVQRASSQFENLNGCLGPALDPKPCSFAHWTRSITIQQERNWGSHHWNASLRATDSLMIIISLWVMHMNVNFSHHCIWGGPKRMQHWRSIISRKWGTEWKICVHHWLYNSFPSKMTPRLLILMKVF